MGVKLFDRNSTPLKLTPAGEHFVREAEELLYKEDQLLRSMELFKSGKNGKLVIGISPFRSLYIVPPIVKEIRTRYPGIQIVLQEKNSTTLRKEVAEGKYDFAIVNLPIDDSLLEARPIEPDTLVLAVPNNLLHLISNPTDKTALSLDLTSCNDLPFIVVGKSQEMRQLFDKMCITSGFHPNIVMEVVGVTTAWAMCHSGIGATLLPLQFISNESFDKDITLFALNDNISSRQPAIVTRRGQYLSDYASFAIESIFKYFNSSKQNN